jgi:hypothetical protein
MAAIAAALTFWLESRASCFSTPVSARHPVAASRGRVPYARGTIDIFMAVNEESFFVLRVGFPVFSRQLLDTR